VSRPDASCPDWNGLVALRGREGREPAGWPEALAHLDACPRCRPEALDADPLLLFRRLPAPEMTPGEESAEVDSMLQAVAAMRTAKRLDIRRGAGWRRWTAAAVLALASLALGHDRAPMEESMAHGARMPLLSPESLAATAEPPASGAPEPGTPTLEDLNRPNARVYQVQRKNFSLVMVVDKGLDV
jgi:hypothetical protein